MSGRICGARNGLWRVVGVVGEKWAVSGIGPVVRVLEVASCVGKGQLRFQWSSPTLGGGLEQNVWVVRVLSTRAVRNQWSSSGRVVVTRNGAVGRVVV
jgi:hypothetical protein